MLVLVAFQSASVHVFGFVAKHNKCLFNMCCVGVLWENVFVVVHCFHSIAKLLISSQVVIAAFVVNVDLSVKSHLSIVDL